MEEFLLKQNDSTASISTDSSSNFTEQTCLESSLYIPRDSIEHLEIFSPHYDFAPSILDYDFHADLCPIPAPPFFLHDQESQESFSCRDSNLNHEYQNNNHRDASDPTLESNIIPQRPLDDENLSLSVTDENKIRDENHSQAQLVILKTGLFIDRKYKRRRKRSQCARGRNPSWAKLALWKQIESKQPHNEVPAHKPRRCTHCQIEKTPQWREGPMGKKTLCNACGLRHKSGRLLPEYRPASSPTFDAAKHSNFHKKVEQMRCNAKRSKEDTVLS